MQFPPLTPAVRALLIVLAVSFVAQAILEGTMGVPVSGWLALTPALDFRLLWTWVTYVLVEGPSTAMRVFDLLIIYWMLSPHEARFGARRAMSLALAGVAAGGLLVLGLGLAFPANVSGAIGASSIGWAAFGAFAQFAGKQPVRFFMLPPASAWLILAVFLAIPFFDSLWTHDAARFLLAIGATGAGIAWARWIMAPRRPAKVTPKRGAGAARLRVIEGGGEGDPDAKPRWLN